MRELKLDLTSLRAAFYSTQVKSGWFKLPVTFRSVNPNLWIDGFVVEAERARADDKVSTQLESPDDATSGRENMT